MPSLSSNGDHLDRTQRSLLPSTSSTTFALVQRVDVGGGEAGAGQPELRRGLALPQLVLLLVLLHQVGEEKAFAGAEKKEKRGEKKHLDI